MSIKELEARARELKELQRMREELEAEITAAQDAIKAHMGGREEVIAGAFKITWKPITSSRFDGTAFKKAHADLAALFVKTTTTRRFCVQ